MTKSLFVLIPIIVFMFLLSVGSSPAAQSKTEEYRRQEVEHAMESATRIFRDFTTQNGNDIPAAQLRDAAGVVIIPNAFRTRVLRKSRQGMGVMVIRSGEDWSLPVAVSLAGGSAGYEIEQQGLNLVILFKNEKDLWQIVQGKPFILAREDAAMVGEQEAAPGTADSDVLAYQSSTARPQFAGITLMGAVLNVKDQATMAYYRIDENALRGYFQAQFPEHGPARSGKMKGDTGTEIQDVPQSAKALRRALAQATASQPEGGPGQR